MHERTTEQVTELLRQDDACIKEPGCDGCP